MFTFIAVKRYPIFTAYLITAVLCAIFWLTIFVLFKIFGGYFYNQPAPNSPIFAYAGAKVTTENGKPICTIASNLYKNTPLRLTFCKDWKIELPIATAPIPAYVADGQAWIRPTTRVTPQLFINGKWVPE